MPDRNRGQVSFAVTAVSILGQAGCVTLLFVLVALVIGLWLDARFSTRPLFTLVLVLASVPVTMYLLFRMVMANVDRLQNLADQAFPKRGVEEGERGREP